MKKPKKKVDLEIVIFNTCLIIFLPITILLYSIGKYLIITNERYAGKIKNGYLASSIHALLLFASIIEMTIFAYTKIKLFDTEYIFEFNKSVEKEISE